MFPLRSELGPAAGDGVWVLVQRFDAERWGAIPRSARLLSESDPEGTRLWDEVHRAWQATAALEQVARHHTLVAIPEAPGPHLVAFRAPVETLPGACFVTEHVARLERVGVELGEQLAEDENVIGSISLDDESFGDFVDECVFRFSRSGDERAYRRAASPALTCITIGALDDGAAELVPRLDVDFRSAEQIDVAALLGDASVYDPGEGCPGHPDAARPARARAPWWRRFF